MPIVNFVLENKNIEVKKGTIIARAARKAGVMIETPCNGAGSCGKCRVKVSNILAVTALQSIKKISKEDIQEGYVLACHTQVNEDVDIYTQYKSEQKECLKILNHGTQKIVEINTYFQKNLREGKTYIYSKEGIAGCEEGDTTDLFYGLSIDIGTTTIVTALIDCISGKEVYSVSGINPQCTYAQDVVSRINFTSQNENGLEVLYKAVNDEINHMIKEITEHTEIVSKYIYEAVYSGNTTMVHLATNTDPYSLGQYPYIPKIKGGCYFTAKEIGLNISPFGIIYIPPIISAYVGSDITSGVLASGLKDQKGNTLFIDIGTNGEMIMASEGKLVATSTAAGPAFEGMNITFGMRAGTGAIEYFEITEDYDILIKTIGESEPVGICGSGLFDIVGELVRVGIIQKSGKFIKIENCELPDKIKTRITKYDGRAAFLIGEGVYLTLLDIRQVQLAKSAIRAGIEAMIGMNDICLDDIDRVFIAGSFGYHLRAKSLSNIGIIPKDLESKIEFVGNTSKTGGIAFLLNIDCREDMLKTVSETESLELADYPGFENLFISSMSF